MASASAGNVALSIRLPEPSSRQVEECRRNDLGLRMNGRGMERVLFLGERMRVLESLSG